MTSLSNHIKVVDGVEYVPLSVAKKAIEEVFQYNSKLDSEMSKVEGYLKNITNTLNTKLEND